MPARRWGGHCSLFVSALQLHLDAICHALVEPDSLGLRFAPLREIIELRWRVSAKYCGPHLNRSILHPDQRLRFLVFALLWIQLPRHFHYWKILPIP